MPHFANISTAIEEIDSSASLYFWNFLHRDRFYGNKGSCRGMKDKEKFTCRYGRKNLLHKWKLFMQCCYLPLHSNISFSFLYKNSWKQACSWAYFSAIMIEIKELELTVLGFQLLGINFRKSCSFPFPGKRGLHWKMGNLE